MKKLIYSLICILLMQYTCVKVNALDDIFTEYGVNKELNNYGQALNLNDKYAVGDYGSLITGTTESTEPSTGNLDTSTDDPWTGVENPNDVMPLGDGMVVMFIFLGLFIIYILIRGFKHTRSYKH